MSVDWLPGLLLLEDYGGDWTRYVEALHQRFLTDFVASKPGWRGKDVRLKRHPEYDGKSATFWHMISEGATEADRTPDMRRCERIAWPRPIMDEHDGAAPGKTACRVLWWTEMRGTETRFHLAPDDFSYVVVVADRGDFVLPWTAYYVEFAYRREKLRKKWRDFWSQKS
ncbi:MAG: hypothetical protein E6Q27_08955 [Aeromicrobium sp.]|nr:MAG: hypothetical protein E6Q27_08955 [Aeromicrobium sp.]HRD73187.1 hypothetical protein [Aquimonas sp.]HRF55034.1 hypothetical protein [Aquimonas sp.]